MRLSAAGRPLTGRRAAPRVPLERTAAKARMTSPSRGRDDASSTLPGVDPAADAPVRGFAGRRVRRGAGAGARSLDAGTAADRAGARAFVRPRQRHHADLLQRDRRPHAAPRRRGARAGAGDEGGRVRGAAEADRAQPAARRQHRQALHQSRTRAAGPDRGRQPRPHPRAGEVRPGARLPLHDVRDVVDPAGGRARDHEPVAHDPAAGARGEGAERRAARAAPPRDARRSRGARGVARRRRASARQADRAGAARDGLQRARRVARRAARSRNGLVDRRRRSPTTARSRRSCCCTTPRSRRGSGSGCPS